MCLSKLPSCQRYWGFNKSQLVIVLAVWDTAALIPAAPREGRVLAGFAEILFTLITQIRVLVYAVGGSRTFLCSGRHAGSAVLKSGVLAWESGPRRRTAALGGLLVHCLSPCLAM